MSGIVYVKKDSESNRLLWLDSGSDVRNGYKPGALLVPYGEYECKIVELPPVAEEETANAIQYHLRSVYPGSPDTTMFDFILYRKSGKAAVFIAKREIIENYRNTWKDIPLTVPLIMVRQLVREHGRHVILFQERECVHVFEFDEGSPERCSGFDQKNILPCIEGLQAKNNETGSNTVISLIGSDSFFSSLEAAGTDNILSRIEMIPFSSRKLTSRKIEPLFAGTKPRRRIPSLLLFLSGVAIVFASVNLYLYRQLLFETQHYKTLSEQMKRLMPEVETVIQLEKEVEELTEHAAGLTLRKPLDVYALFNRLYSITRDELEIESFLLKEDSFQIEGYSRNPYELVKRIEEDGHFIDMKTYNVQPLQDRGVERFTFSGRFRSD